MIRMTQSMSALQAKSYFNEALLKSDYYLEDQELTGTLRGRLISRLGIENCNIKPVFEKLCENLHPLTNSTLTQRQKQNRTTGYDFTFLVPKSVSLLHVLSKDNHILEAFQHSVNETMCDIEKDSMARIRKKGQDENRTTGELIWGEFIHQTARPVQHQSPDPHLHAHCFTFNVTWDDAERIYKAAQFRFIKRDMPFYQARFHKRLSDNLIKLGYRIRRTRKSFEIAGIPQQAIDHFSKRAVEVIRYAKDNNIADPKQRAQLAARTRSKKQKGLTMTQLKKDWRKQIHTLGLKDNQANGKIIRHSSAHDIHPVTAQQCVDYALQHCFERQSVVQDRSVIKTAYWYGLGTSALSIDAITKTFKKDSQIIQVTDGDTIFFTTQKVMNEEQEMINLARLGKSIVEPFYKSPPLINLKDQQLDAACMVLTTKDQVCCIAGRAGTGKTTMMKETIRLIEATGRKVFVAAPTAQAARNVLKDEGFEHAETVAKLLTHKKLQEDLKNGVLWMDEPGLLGVSDMTALLRMAATKNIRIILSGDDRQHSSVSRGDALRLLRTFSGLTTVEIDKIYRQQPEEYRKAVRAISDGDIETGFDLLNSMGSIVEIDPLKPARKVVKDYFAAIEQGKSILVISPTHNEGNFITKEIRKVYKSKGRIAKDDTPIPRLINLNMTEGEKMDGRNYTCGQIIQFTQNSTGIKRGSVWIVNQIKGNTLMLCDKNSNQVEFALKNKNHFDVFEQGAIAIAKGDSVRINRNGYDLNRNRLNNGQELEVLGFDKQNNIRLRNTKSKKHYTLPQDFGHLSHAYCMTSHASQGKTVDEVLIYQPTETFPASDLKQFYVSVSRGRYNAKVYCYDKNSLFKQVSSARNRISALELIAQNNQFIDVRLKKLKSKEKGYSP